MLRLTIDVNPNQEALFLAILETFKNQNVIKLKKKEIVKINSDSHSFPGSPMTQKELGKILEESQNQPSISYEKISRLFKGTPMKQKELDNLIEESEKTPLVSHEKAMKYFK